MRWAGVLIGVQAVLAAAFGLFVLLLIVSVNAMRWEGNQLGGSRLTPTEAVVLVVSLGGPALLWLFARRVRQGRRWARTVVLVLGWAGLAAGTLGILAAVGNGDTLPPESAVLIGLAQPILILILALLHSRPAREFFDHTKRRRAAR